MSEKGKKLEPPLHLDMDFGEALARFARTKPAEVAESIERSKQKRPPGAMVPGSKAPEGQSSPKRQKAKRT